MDVKCPVCGETISITSVDGFDIIAVEHCCPPHIVLLYLSDGKLVGIKPLSDQLVIFRRSYLSAFKLIEPRLSAAILLAAVRGRLKELRGDGFFVSVLKWALATLGLRLSPDGDVVVDLWTREIKGDLDKRELKALEKILKSNGTELEKVLTYLKSK